MNTEEPPSPESGEGGRDPPMSTFSFPLSRTPKRVRVCCGVTVVKFLY